MSAADRSDLTGRPPRSERLSADTAIARVVDVGSWRGWPGDTGSLSATASQAPPVQAADPQYAQELQRARTATGQDEAVLVGEATVGGVRAALLVWEFGFLGGSIAVATAARLVMGIRRATREGLPLLALPRSGGTRMQEGTPAFIQMTAITAAVAEHRAARLPYLVHLCHPTTGGVLATLGSAGDLTTAEPGAMIGFLGPRAVAAITGRGLRPDVQSAENLVAHGVVDEVLEWSALRSRWVRALRLWRDRRPRAGSADGPDPGPQSPTSDPDPRAQTSGPGPLARSSNPGQAPATAEALWAYVTASRDPDRPGAQAWLHAFLTDRIELTATGTGEVGSGVRAGLGRLFATPLAYAATVDRETGAPLTADGLRVLRRVISLAASWQLPLLTVVDTLGAELSDAAEERGIAGEISRTMLDLVSCPTPTGALLVGPGTGGSALALLAVDRVVATSGSWVAPLPPEGAAAIRHHGSHDPARVAWEQTVGVHALARIGLVDVVIDESRPHWPEAAAEVLSAQLAEAVAGVDPDRRVARFQAWSNAAP